MHSQTTALHKACSDKHGGTAKQLARAHPEWVAQDDESGSFPLHIAAARGLADVVPLLLEVHRGAALKKNKEFGALPMHMAVMSGHADVVELLIPCGGLEEKDAWERCPIDLARNGDKPATRGVGMQK